MQMLSTHYNALLPGVMQSTVMLLWAKEWCHRKPKSRLERDSSISTISWVAKHHTVWDVVPTMSQKMTKNQWHDRYITNKIMCHQLGYHSCQSECNIFVGSSDHFIMPDISLYSFLAFLSFMLFMVLCISVHLNEFLLDALVSWGWVYLKYRTRA